jgi:hypothetical protein
MVTASKSGKASEKEWSQKIMCNLRDLGVASREMSGGNFVHATPDAMWGGAGNGLLVIVPGSGSTCPGFWSTAQLCESQGEDVGSVAPYVVHALQREWGVLVLEPKPSDCGGSPLPRARCVATHC